MVGGGRGGCNGITDDVIGGWWGQECGAKCGGCEMRSTINRSSGDFGDGNGGGGVGRR